MRFSAATFTLGLFAIAQAGFVPYGGKKEDFGIETFKGKFALAVKEFNFKKGKGKGWWKGGKKEKLDLLYEIGDGQIEYGGRDDQVYYPWGGRYKQEPFDDDDDDDYKKHKYPEPEPVEEDDDGDNYGKHKWKPRGYKEPEAEEFRTIKYNKNHYYFTLKNTVLHDERYATGEIVANHQFQFDDPVQPDALFTKGFTIVFEDGEYLLAINGKTKFWNSAVDDTGVYKVYDAPITDESEPIQLIVLDVEGKKYGKKKW
ncbi:putative cell wall mannoprotein PIR32 [Candida viswanathii]|uniref:Putative cell wall mannoprotein PIR32 n=1 Tax=Candida viswanathii TaxID=5486 RepID=A0A367YDA9_9ASCO|nr:putative cell wall mannoprotein PIR32 [Candida viswanathii]